MAHIIGAVTTSHVPAIGGAIARGAQQDAYWKPFFDGFTAVHDWLAQARPDIAVVFYNDHGLNFFLDKMPTFAIGAASEYRNEDEGWGLPPVRSFVGDPALSWHLIQSLMEDEFDITTCQEMLVDHAFTIPMSLLWPGGNPWPVRVVPIEINTVQHPLPSAARCFSLGQSVGRAIEQWNTDAKVLIVGTGGLSHQLDGQRAGYINRDFDLLCMEKIVADPGALTRYSNTELIRLAGSQGVELLMWLAARGALHTGVRKLHSNYHIPISSTASAVMLLENAA
jgi:protocatechuate 4,5-dioxygenase, beta chain